MTPPRPLTNSVYRKRLFKIQKAQNRMLDLFYLKTAREISKNPCGCLLFTKPNSTVQPYADEFDFAKYTFVSQCLLSLLTLSAS